MHIRMSCDRDSRCQLIRLKRKSLAHYRSPPRGSVYATRRLIKLHCQYAGMVGDIFIYVISADIIMCKTSQGLSFIEMYKYKTNQSYLTYQLHPPTLSTLQAVPQSAPYYY